MNAELTEKYSLRSSDFDEYERIKAEAVLDLFQDAACKHAEEFGIGHNKLSGKSLIWVIVKMKIEIKRNPELYSSVIVKTWPLEPGRFTFQRDCKMTDEKGKILVIGTSEWAVIDSKERTLVPSADIFPKNVEYSGEKCFNESIFRVKRFEHTTPVFSVIPKYSDIDVNGHVNNSKYARYIADAVCPNKKREIKAMQIDFNKEILVNNEITVYTSESKDSILIAGDNTNGINMFSAKVELR